MTEDDVLYTHISEKQLKALMIKAMQELEAKVRKLEERVKQLEQYHD